MQLSAKRFASAQRLSDLKHASRRDFLIVVNGTKEKIHEVELMEIFLRIGIIEKFHEV